MRPDGTQQDQMLLAQLRSGDEASFAALVRRWTPAMLRLADNYVPSREVSEEVVQDSWMAVLKAIGAFEGRSTVRTWVFRIVVRRAQQTGIRERRSVPFSSAWQQERGASVDPSRFHPAPPAANAGGWINPVGLTPLTHRELQVLCCLGRGLQSKSIANVLSLGVRTCRGYIKSLHIKLDVSTQLEAVINAQPLGLIGWSGDR